MVDWYQTVLDAEKRYEGDLVALLHYDDEHHRIAILNVPQLARQERGSYAGNSARRRRLDAADGDRRRMPEAEHALYDALYRAYEQADQVRLIARVRGRCDRSSFLNRTKRIPDAKAYAFGCVSAA